MNIDHPNNIAILIIAAGQSFRLGQPKQLLPFGQTTLLQHSIDACVQSSARDVHIVLGAFANEIKDYINFQNCQVHLNKAWKEGMGTSISFGVKEIRHMNYDAIIISMCDQPYLSKQHINAIIAKHQAKKTPIVISKYDIGQGPPVLFQSELYPALIQLRGELGAKEVIQSSPYKIEKISFPFGYIDIDTAVDLRHLK